MGRCSYTWKEIDTEKREYVKKQCQKETWKDSDEFCTFHDPSPDKDVDLFKKKLDEQIESETEYYNFIGYCFPENWDFFKWKFEIDVDFYKATFQYANFTKATFQGTAYFRWTTFQGTANFFRASFQDAIFSKTIFQDAIFSKTIFQGRINFIGATFQDTANFIGATFQDTANFIISTFQNFADFFGTTFQYANFIGATFQDATFSEATFQDGDFGGARIKEFFEFNPKKVTGILNFRDTKFFFSGSIIVDLENTLFHRSHLQNIAFIDCTWPDNHKIYEEKHMDNEDINLSFNQLETIYRDLKQNMQNHGDYNTAGEFYYREMEMRRKGSDSKKNRLWFEVYRLLAGYGEHPIRTAISSIFTILVFAFFYLISECLQYPMENPTIFQKIESTIYFSFVTFTTLGLGDIRPLTRLGRTLICCEAVIGAFLIALFVVVFARKMMR